MKIDSYFEGKIINSIEPFNDIYINCYMNAQLSIINSLSGTIIPYIFNDIYYYDYCYKNETPLIALKHRPIYSSEKLLNDIGLNMSTYFRKDDIISDLIYSVDNEHPVIIAIDYFYESIRPDTFNKIHGDHYITIFGYNNDQYFNIIEHNYINSIIYEKKQISFFDLKNCYYGVLDLLNGESYPTYIEFYKIKDKEFDDKHYISKYIENFCLNEDSILSSLSLIDDYSGSITNLLENNKISIINVDQIMDSLNNLINDKNIERYRFLKVFGDNKSYISSLDTAISCWNTVRAIITKYKYTETISRKSIDNIKLKLAEVKQYEYSSYNILYNFFESR